MTSSRRQPQGRAMQPRMLLHCCSFLLVLVLVAADFEYYPDSEGGGSSSSSEADAEAQVRLERLVRLLERRSHHYEHQQQDREREQEREREREREEEQEEEEEEAAARQQWSSRLLQQTLAMQRERQREQQLLREQGELLEQPELLERPEVIDLLQEAARQRERQRELERMRQRQRLLYEYQTRQRQQQQQRLQELDYPELRGGLEHERPRPEFTYSFDPLPSQSQPRPFAVGPQDPRFYSNQAWNRQPEQEQQRQQQQQQQQEEQQREEEIETTTTRIHPTKVALQEQQQQQQQQQQVVKVEQRRASMSGGNAGLAEELQVISLKQKLSNEDVYVIALVAGCSAALMFVLVLMSLLWCRLQRVSKAAKDVDYPAYGVTGPNKDLSPSSAADQRLAQSAQMYHFQHQKQQIIAMEKASTGAAREPGSVSEAESDEENDEGDYTVYECPGLAPTGEMEVKNPLFHDEPTPQTPAKSKHEYTTDEDDL